MATDSLKSGLGRHPSFPLFYVAEECFVHT
jgi:hypothetical protein